MHNTNANKILSHPLTQVSLSEKVQQRITEITERGALVDISVAEQLDLLEQLTTFNLGRFVLLHGGLNGVWTQYLCLHPTHGRLTERNDEGLPFCDLEYWLLNRAPLTLATQQRFTIFQELCQHLLCEDIHLASVPCGLMDDLLTLDYAHLSKFKLTGIDLDAESLSLALTNAKQKNLLAHAQFLQRDAWALDIDSEFDVLLSNGLNIYETDEDRVIDLYRHFHHSLKPGGVLITSFFTPPPTLDPQSPWKLDQIDLQDLLKQKILFNDILAVHFHAFRTEAQTRAQLEEVGFQDIQLHWDQGGLFPTVVAKKVT